MAFWNQKTFCLVTGASRGIGQTIAIEFSKKVGVGSLFLLAARTESGLKETKTSIEESSSNCEVATASIDLSVPNKDKFLDIILKAIETSGRAPSDFDHAILVHNAANLGIKQGLKVEEIEDLDYIHEFYSFNLFSLIVLNTQFFKVFKEGQCKQRSVVQISSDGAVQPFKTWGLYCAGKAARDQLMKSLALESGIQTINWAPGCVQTSIYDEAVQYTADPGLSQYFKEAREAGQILTREQTVLRLIKTLSTKKYINGEHVSYNDVE